jgi:hypothetical protein
MVGDKQELITRLTAFAVSKDCNWKGQKAFVRFLIEYLKRNTMPGDDPRYKEFVFIDQYLDSVILDAVTAFRTSNETYVVKIRQEYERDTEREVPDINTFSLDVSFFVQTYILSTLKTVLGEGSSYTVNKIETLLKSHFNYLNKVFRNFIYMVWRTGVCELIEKASKRGLKGVFGDVTLLTWTMCARTAIQFDKEDGSSVSFTAGEDDYEAYSAGLNFCNVDLVTAVQMIETVINNWPRDKQEQAKRFCPDKNVKHIAVAVMEAQQKVETNSATQ